MLYLLSWVFPRVPVRLYVQQETLDMGLVISGTLAS